MSEPTHAETQQALNVALYALTLSAKDAAPRMLEVASRRLAAARPAPSTPAAEPAACTGLTAAWCPVHGDCVCTRSHDSDAMKGVPSGTHPDMAADDCPLHNMESDHPRPSTPADTVPVPRVLVADLEAALGRDYDLVPSGWTTAAARRLVAAARAAAEVPR